MNSIINGVLYTDEIKQEHINDIYRIESRSIVGGWSNKTFENDIRKKNTYYTIAVAGKRVIAFCGASYVFNEAEITNIAVDAEYQKTGIAQNMLNIFFEFCKNNNIYTVYLEVRESNIPAVNLYSKNKFKIIGIRKNYYTDTNENALNMKKIID